MSNIYLATRMVPPMLFLDMDDLLKMISTTLKTMWTIILMRNYVMHIYLTLDQTLPHESICMKGNMKVRT